MKSDERELKRSIMKLESLLCDIYDAMEIPSKYCPICGSDIRLFTPAGEKLRPNAKCPVCGSLERMRAWWLYYHKIGLLGGVKRRIKLLHFAPEKPFMELYKNDENVDYYPVDYDANFEGIRDRVDITKIPYDDKQFDVIICNHVLEHIQDEKMALKECRRVLKDNGTFFLSVPFSENEGTLEKTEYNTDELRSKYYGQYDHVRLYGLDVSARLQSTFHVEEIDCIDELQLDEKQIRRYGLQKKEIIWKLTKYKADDKKTVWS